MHGARLLIRQGPPYPPFWTPFPAPPLFPSSNRRILGYSNCMKILIREFGAWREVTTDVEGVKAMVDHEAPDMNLKVMVILPEAALPPVDPKP